MKKLLLALALMSCQRTTVQVRIDEPPPVVEPAVDDELSRAARLTRLVREVGPVRALERLEAEGRGR